LAEYTIPKSQRPSLDKLRTIPEPILQRLISAWTRSANSVSSVEGISDAEASELTIALLELFRVREYFDEKIPEFASGVATALQRDLKFPTDQIPAFEDRIARLLAVTPIAISAKTTSLGMEYERRFCTARILTDARPVFVESPSSRPEAMIITHTLRLTFHDDTDEMREVYLTLNSKDLITLRELVDRAEEKTKSLTSLFAASNVPVVELNEA